MAADRHGEGDRDAEQVLARADARLAVEERVIEGVEERHGGRAAEHERLPLQSPSLGLDHALTVPEGNRRRQWGSPCPEGRKCEPSRYGDALQQVDYPKLDQQ